MEAVEKEVEAMIVGREVELVEVTVVEVVTGMDQHSLRRPMMRNAH